MHTLLTLCRFPVRFFFIPCWPRWGMSLLCCSPLWAARTAGYQTTRRWVLVVLAWMVCTAQAWAQANSAGPCLERALQVDGQRRTGWVCPPTVANRQAPLLLAFHGRGSSGAEMAQALALHTAWPHALVVYPDGLPGNPAPNDPQGRQRGWQIHPGEMGDRDLAMVRAMMPALQQRWGFDCRRVYALGHSNGARMVAIAWARMGAQLASVAFSAAPPDTLVHEAVARDVFLGMGLTDPVVSIALQRPSIALVGQRLDVAAALPDGSQPGQWRLIGRSGHTLSLLVHAGGHVWPEGQTRQILALFESAALPACTAG